MPDNLIVEGIPAIPQSIVTSVGRYTEFRSAGFAGWNPTKKEMLVLTRFGDTAQVHQVSMPGGDRHQLTFYPDSIAGAQFGPVNSDWFLFRKDVGGNEFFQIYRYDLATGESTLLTDGKSRNTDENIAPDGKTLVYVSTRRTGNDTDLYMMDVTKPASDKMVMKLPGGGWGPLDIADDNNTVILQNYVSAAESHLYLADLGAGTQADMLPDDGSHDLVAFGAAVFGPNGRSIYYTSDKGTEFQELRRFDVATGNSKSLTHDIPWDIGAVVATKDRNKIAFTVNANGSDEVYVLDTKNDAIRKMAGIPVGVMSGLSWNNNGVDLGFSLSNSKSSNDAYSYDTKSGKLTRWTFSETGGLNAQTFQETQLIKWKSFDGREISGWMNLPPSKFSGPRPVMIEIHGGPEGEARPGFIGRYNYYINELGIAVIQPNVRGSTGFGKTFAKIDNGVLRADTYKDIGALLDWIKTQPSLDANKVLITGGSYGGHMAYAISYVYADRIAASIPVVGISNIVTFLENTSGYRRDLRRAEYGDERDPKVREYLESIAPMNHPNEIKKPVFVIAGQNDPRVPITEASQFKDKIKSTNANVWYLVGKDEGHGFAKKKNRDFQMYATVLFMQKFLLGN